jgi:hypothetical protein
LRRKAPDTWRWVVDLTRPECDLAVVACIGTDEDDVRGRFIFPRAAVGDRLKLVERNSDLIEQFRCHDLSSLDRLLCRENVTEAIA